MDHDETKAYLKDDTLDETDRVLLRLYEKANEPIDRDESDDAVLAFAHSAAADFKDSGSGDVIGAAQGPSETAAPGEEAAGEEDAGGNVVSFRRRERPSGMRFFYRSPVAGFAIAASLVIGIFAGQALNPYVDLGVAPQIKSPATQPQAGTESPPLTRSIKILGSGSGSSTPETPAPSQRGPAVGGTAPTQTPSTGDSEDDDEDKKAKVTASLPQEPGSDFKKMAAILRGASCADLSMTLSQNGDIKLSGYVAKREDLQKILKELGDFGKLGTVTDSVSIYGWPVCGALDILKHYTNKGIEPADRVTVRAINHGPVYTEGENLIFEAMNSGQGAAYLYVDFVQNDGSVVHMLPFARNPRNKVGPGENAVLGAKNIQYVVSKPFGTEVVTVIASPVPLFDKPREEVEKADAYFKQLRAVLFQRIAQGHGGQISSGYKVLTTKAK